MKTGLIFSLFTIVSGLASAQSFSGPNTVELTGSAATQAWHIMRENLNKKPITFSSRGGQAPFVTSSAAIACKTDELGNKTCYLQMVNGN